MNYSDAYLEIIIEKYHESLNKFGYVEFEEWCKDPDESCEKIIIDGSFTLKGIQYLYEAMKSILWLKSGTGFSVNVRPSMHAKILNRIADRLEDEDQI